MQTFYLFENDGVEKDWETAEQDSAFVPIMTVCKYEYSAIQSTDVGYVSHKYLPVCANVFLWSYPIRVVGPKVGVPSNTTLKNIKFSNCTLGDQCSDGVAVDMNNTLGQFIKTTTTSGGVASWQSEDSFEEENDEDQEEEFMDSDDE